MFLIMLISGMFDWLNRLMVCVVLISVRFCGVEMIIVFVGLCFEIIDSCILLVLGGRLMIRMFVVF